MEIKISKKVRAAVFKKKGGGERETYSGLVSKWTDCSSSVSGQQTSSVVRSRHPSVVSVDVNDGKNGLTNLQERERKKKGE